VHGEADPRLGGPAGDVRVPLGAGPLVALELDEQLVRADADAVPGLEAHASAHGLSVHDHARAAVEVFDEQPGCRERERRVAARHGRIGQPHRCCRAASDERAPGRDRQHDPTVT
jgi:hypothetical protein